MGLFLKILIKRRPIQRIFCFRVAENQHERIVEVPRKTHPSLFWSKYWNSRLPGGRDQYDHDQHGYQGDYEDSQVRTKSIRNNRLDPRHVRIPAEEVERFDGSNALKLKSSSDSSRSISVLVVAAVLTLVRLWWWWNLSSPGDKGPTSVREAIVITDNQFLVIIVFITTISLSFSCAISHYIIIIYYIDITCHPY